MSRWIWLLRNLFRRLWVTAALYSVLGVATAMSALWLDRFLPSGLSSLVGADAVDRILGILASSMLAVTTFSIATMVSAYTAASTGATPRATKLLMEDRTAQRALATFLGAFLFSIVSIVALATGAYGANGRIILFFVTIAVIVLIALVLLQWIDKLARLGRVTETIDEVERAASAAMREHARQPFMGARNADAEPAGGMRVFGETIGYLQHIDIASLSALADKHEADITVTMRAGAFVSPDRALAVFSGQADAGIAKDICAAFTIGDVRSYDQDPRFGLIVLSEIASRALSPAVNDPGTAIDVIGTAVRVLAILRREAGDDVYAQNPPDAKYSRVRVPPITAFEFFDDVFTPIARDGASLVEVAIRLQKALTALAAMDARFAGPAAYHARLSMARAEAAMTMEDDRKRVRAAAALIASPA